MRRVLFCAALVLAGCPTRGTLNGDCNPDGTCNAPGLSCQLATINLMTSGLTYRCLLKDGAK